MRLLKWQLVLILVLHFIVGEAQEANLTVLYTNNSGITYAGKNKKEIRIFAGLNLPIEGKITVTKGSWANILLNGQKVKLEGPKVYDVEELASTSKSKRSPKFMRRFMSFLSNSVQQTDNAKELEKYHRQYLTEARAGINGFGDKTYPIQQPLYLSQVLGLSETTFNWTSVEDAQYYEFTISARDMDQTVLKVLTKENSFQTHLADLAFSQEQIYQWQVVAILEKDSSQQSAPLFFTYYPQLVEEIIEEIKGQKGYEELDAFEQPLYLVSKMEEEGLYQNAYHLYQGLINNDPENFLYKKLFAAFLARMDALEEGLLLVD